jgi:hypothetical protein
VNDDTGVASLRRYERCSGSSGMISTLLLAMQFIDTMYQREKKQ